MGMTIDDSERYLRLMLGGMKYAVEYWKDKDKVESDIEQTNVEAVETALDIMHKYQKIKRILKEPCIIPEGCYPMLKRIKREVEDEKGD